MEINASTRSRIKFCDTTTVAATIDNSHKIVAQQNKPYRKKELQEQFKLYSLTYTLKHHNMWPTRKVLQSMIIWHSSQQIDMADLKFKDDVLKEYCQYNLLWVLDVDSSKNYAYKNTRIKNRRKVKIEITVEYANK